MTRKLSSLDEQVHTQHAKMQIINMLMGKLIVTAVTSPRTHKNVFIALL